MASGISIELDIDAQCVGCGAERERAGRLIAEGDGTVIVEAPTPCEACGERRVRVTVDVGESRETRAETED